METFSPVIQALYDAAGNGSRKRQSYDKFNRAPGLGVQILRRPNGSVAMVSNNNGRTDTLGISDGRRAHTDDSIQVKYLDRSSRALDKAAFTVAVDAGCEFGGGTSCASGKPGMPAQYFLGFMAYNRFRFPRDLAETPGPRDRVPGFAPDLRKYENRYTLALLVNERMKYPQLVETGNHLSGVRPTALSSSVTRLRPGNQI
jgi:hypothetical protein